MREREVRTANGGVGGGGIKHCYYYAYVIVLCVRRIRVCVKDEGEG